MEAAVGNETDGRRKEIADKILALAEKSELFCATGSRYNSVADRVTEFSFI